MDVLYHGSPHVEKRRRRLKGEEHDRSAGGERRARGPLRQAQDRTGARPAAQARTRAPRGGGVVGARGTSAGGAAARRATAAPARHGSWLASGAPVRRSRTARRCAYEHGCALMRVTQARCLLRGAPSGGGRDGASAAARNRRGGRVSTAGRKYNARVMFSRTRAVGWARAWPTSLVAMMKSRARAQPTLADKAPYRPGRARRLPAGLQRPGGAGFRAAGLAPGRAGGSDNRARCAGVVVRCGGGGEPAHGAPPRWGGVGSHDVAPPHRVTDCDRRRRRQPHRVRGRRGWSRWRTRRLGLRNCGGETGRRGASRCARP